MRAFAVFPKRKVAEVIETIKPEISSPTDVELRVLDVGICGTDREIAEWHYGIPPADQDHLIIGHESLCEVVAVGAEVENITPGDLVVPSVRRPCPQAGCSACRSRRQDFCYTGDFKERGIKQLHGFMAERVVDHAEYLTPVPRELREVGVLVEPLTIAEKALAQIWQVQQRLPWTCSVDRDALPSQGCTALVLGAGPVGLLGAMALVDCGFRTFVYSREPDGGPRSQIVEGFGAKYLSASKVSVSELDGLLDGIDVVYEATGASGLAFEVLKELGTNGVYVFTGVPGRKHPVEIEAGTIMQNLVLKNQVLFGTVNADADAFTSAVDRLGRFMTRWPDIMRSIIARRWQLEDVPQLLSDPGPGIKHVVSIEGN
jgi:threonine dehydrogenase-like Zn-dependent dehydrogenase